ncbi:hypothetical protein JOF56_007934 [Kibdelosporangium banguiense]|uniref:Uncharacterized protein n=1 Tax=Kibdelosporangium banguiense TaxID=1365924 RepID=A0ABS4TUA4_9PSEU|nr:hypothetical protein [Kibdelosporangium banguiense]MBP2327549.1 hypothetical protein [Kibdelosporangium banguiense]
MPDPRNTGMDSPEAIDGMAEQRRTAALALLERRFGQPPAWALDDVYRDHYGVENPFPPPRTADAG